MIKRQQLVGAFAHAVGHRLQERGALLRRRARPRRERVGRAAAAAAARLVGARLGSLVDDVLGGRVDDVVGAGTPSTQSPPISSRYGLTVSDTMSANCNPFS